MAHVPEYSCHYRTLEYIKIEIDPDHFATITYKYNQITKEQTISLNMTQRSVSELGRKFVDICTTSATLCTNTKLVINMDYDSGYSCSFESCEDRYLVQAINDEFSKICEENPKYCYIGKLTLNIDDYKHKYIPVVNELLDIVKTLNIPHVNLSSKRANGIFSHANIKEYKFTNIYYDIEFDEEKTDESILDYEGDKFPFDNRFDPQTFCKKFSAYEKLTFRDMRSLPHWHKFEKEFEKYYDIEGKNYGKSDDEQDYESFNVVFSKKEEDNEIMVKPAQYE